MDLLLPIRLEDGGRRLVSVTHPPKLKEFANSVTHGHFGVKSRVFRLLLGLILFYTEDGELNFLVIEEQEDRHLFERLESCHLNNEGDVLLTMEAGRGLWGGIELDWKYICLV
jgi:hypothetical protein